MTLDAKRLEELGLNSSAPPGQLLYDGWILRLLPGKAKRARSINPVFASSITLEEKIAYCERLYSRAGLPTIFRITPFTVPGNLDAELARRGFGRFDETAVESASLPESGNGRDAGGAKPREVRFLPLLPWVEAVARLRGFSPGHLASHAARLEGVPLEKLAAVVLEQGQVVATGLAMIEGEAVGLFDVVTHEAHRRAGHARGLVAALLDGARARGARDAYLQVQHDNGPARALYRQFGFVERYRYWYRGREGERH